MDINVIQANADEASKLLKTMANTSRLLVLCALVTREHTAGELEELTGLSQPAISQHLARMRHMGVVDIRRDAQTIYYSITGDKVTQVVSLVYELYCSEGD